MPEPALRVLLTCEHGGNRVPPALAARFAPHADLLASHRGWDPGALDLARRFARELAADLIAAETSRLVVDLNRSPHHPRVFSEITRPLPAPERRNLLARYHAPHRAQVADALAALLRRTTAVLHLGIHSFTPILAGVPRNADIGLLYDPQRPAERDFCRRWQAHLRAAAPAFRVRLNYPYRGVADGLTTTLRRRWPADRYLGIELEVNQHYPLSDPPRWRHLQDALLATLSATLAHPAG